MKLYQFCASIVAYENSPEDIVSALRSILSVPMRVKCSVIDNSPTQNLRSHVLDTGAEYVYTGANIGFGSGHNLALRSDLGDSEYHIVLNPDVSFGSEVLITLYGFMNDHLDVGLVMPQILYPDGAEQRLCKLIPAPLDLISRRFLGGLGRSMLSTRLCRYELRDLDLSVAREIPCLSGCFMFMRSATLSEVGLFDERYFMYMEDVDLCRRIGETLK
jgi:GT2 family glycosyltransferase